MNSDHRDFDWGEIITKPVYTIDDKHVGHVDGLENACLSSIPVSLFW